MKPHARGILRIACLWLAMAATPIARAEVSRVEIIKREPFAGGRAFGHAGPYERIVGRLYFEVDPLAPANARVHDLKLAPRNDGGRVEFWSDFFLLKPVQPALGNRRLFYDVNNRGNKLALGAFNNAGGNDPASEADAGNGFLMRQGYSILWCGWNGDVRPGDGRLQIGLPVATENGQPIRGLLHAEIVVDRPAADAFLAWGNTAPYPVINEADATVTVRDPAGGRRRPIPAARRAFARLENGVEVPDPTRLLLRDGFQPGFLYEVVYESEHPRITGLGFAAVRDAIAYFRHADGAAPIDCGPIDRSYIFGISQSGRFIHHFVYEGFNTDEAGRQVFDGAMAHVAGAGKGLFNGRFVQTTRHGSQLEDNLYPSEAFPLAPARSVDPETGRAGDTLERARAAGHVPKMFFTQTSTEYWSRAASLLHTDVTGSRDLSLDPSVRLYVVSGAQHGVSGSLDRGIYHNSINVLDHRPVLRAMLVALDQWASWGVEPPASRHPRIADGTLIELEAYRSAFPPIEGVALPAAMYTPRRLDLGPRWESEGIADHVPPEVGAALRTLVPAIDADGNEIAGIRLPDVVVPVAAYTGWNTRREEFGAAGALGRWSGSTLPFEKTEADRKRTGDSRPSIMERYPTRAAYLERYIEAAQGLVSDRFLLADDALELVRIAGEREWIKNDGE